MLLCDKVAPLTQAAHGTKLKYTLDGIPATDKTLYLLLAFVLEYFSCKFGTGMDIKTARAPHGALCHPLHTGPCATSYEKTGAKTCIVSELLHKPLHLPVHLDSYLPHAAPAYC